MDHDRWGDVFKAIGILTCGIVGLYMAAFVLVFVVDLVLDAISYVVGFEVTVEGILISIFAVLSVLAVLVLVPHTIFQIIERRRDGK